MRLKVVDHLRTGVSNHILKNFVRIAWYEVIKDLSYVSTDNIIGLIAPKILDQPSHCAFTPGLFILGKH